MNKNGESAIERARALFAKTTANRATEAEAISAAEKAAELMDRYGLEQSDLELKETKCGREEVAQPPHEVVKLAPAIARFCSVRTWRRAGRVQYFGMPVDVEIAVFLTDLIRHSMNAEFRIFSRSSARPLNVKPYRLRLSFMVGMQKRLTERLDEMTEARKAAAKTASGTALVVVKDAVVTEQFKALGLKMTTRKNRSRMVNSHTMNAGIKAGDRVNITQGVGSTRRQKELLH